MALTPYGRQIFALETHGQNGKMGQEEKRRRTGRRRGENGKGRKELFSFPPRPNITAIIIIVSIPITNITTITPTTTVVVVIIS